MESISKPHDGQFFQPEDWRSFGLTSALVFTVYFLTLAPDVTLEHSGIYSTAANYAGVAPPPGYPLWTILGWFFVKAIPFGPIAWRLEIFSAVAGALTCGLIALMVSRCGAVLVQNIAGTDPLKPTEERSLRIVCGCVAGMAFGFSNGFWYLCVVVDVWPLSMLLFTVTICLLTRWFWMPEQMRYFHAAIFLYGLSLTNSQILFAAAPGFQLLIALGKPTLGRDILFTTGILLILFLGANAIGALSFQRVTKTDSMWLLTAAIIMGTLGGVLAIRTRGLLTEWRSVAGAGVLFLFGLMPYFYIAVASMTTPPVNWGYPRTVEGFFHVLNRGQYESIRPTDSLNIFVRQVGLYAQIVTRDFGLIFLFPAIASTFFLHEMQPLARKWISALLGVYLSLVFLLVVVLNPAFDRQSEGLVSFYFSASYPVLGVLAGCGLVLIGTAMARGSGAKANAHF
jgi:hypothetical protein